MNGETSLDIVWEPPTQLSSLDCWDYSIELDCLRGPEDLHLAAELGKTLLERNKELENCIKLHQCTIDDQAQEIEYMKKQTAALREVNDSRIKIYEQLEISIQDLERANHRLALENANDKKQIKSQCLTIDTLEARVDELQKKLDELNARYESLMREQQTAKSQLSDPTPATNVRTTDSRDGSTHNTAVSPRRSSPDEDACKIQQLASAMVNDEDVTKLLQQLQESRFQRAREQKKVAELKEQLDAVLLEHTQMEEQLNLWKTKAQDMKNLQDEINTLEEVRQGHLCGRCLRGTDSRAQDELSVMLDQEEEDDEISLAESLAESVRDADTTLQELGQKRELSEEENCHSYRVLVEKYEALLKIQQNPAYRRKQSNGGGGGGVGAGAGLSLQEELQMSGEFSHFNSAGQSEADSSLQHYGGLQHDQNGRSSVSSASGGQQRHHRGSKKPFAGTPTDFSEAETSSSGFSDETSNKSTQTDSRPGSLLCSIADGEDCKFSIYDDSSNFESRFHKTPEHRVIFSEIFRVLKRAAEAKDVGTELPLLEEDSAASTAEGQLTPRAEGCPQGSPFSCAAAREEAPSESCTDDTRSVASLAVSSVVSEPVFRVHTPVLSRKHLHERSGPSSSSSAHCNALQAAAAPHQSSQNAPETRSIPRRLQLNESHQTKQPLQANNCARRQPLEYLSLQVRKKGSSSAKKSSRRLSSAAAATESSSSPAGTPDVIPTANPKIVQLKAGSRRRFRPLNASDGLSDGHVWNGNTAHFYPSKSPRGRHQQQSSFSRENFPTGAPAAGAHLADKSTPEYRPSAASEEVAKLRMLEMSYAEVLRMPNKSKAAGVSSAAAAARHHKHHR